MSSSSVAFLFPGQGRIPKSLPTDDASLRSLLALTSQAGLELEAWIEQEQTDRLTQTDAAQPALYLDSLSRDRRLKRQGWAPSCVAGHSLGEYAALTSAGVIEPAQCVHAVLERGRLMSPVRGAMAAIVKLEIDAVRELCQGTDAVLANHNGRTQVVISGPQEAVDYVMDAASSVGGKAIALKVSGPFHSPLMQPAQDELSGLLESLDFASPSISVVSAVSGRVETFGDNLKELLCRQMTAMVRWVDVMNELERLGIETAVEVGSGDVLTRLGNRSGSSIRYITYQEALDERL